jgi:hypothetical protein
VLEECGGFSLLFALALCPYRLAAKKETRRALPFATGFFAIACLRGNRATDVEISEFRIQIAEFKICILAIKLSNSLILFLICISPIKNLH